jgi:hypothetical protein
MTRVTRVLATHCAIAVALSVPAQAATKTSVVVFSAWSSGSLRSGFVVTNKVKGKCWTHSLSTNRPDAWRCMESSDIYDPCFSSSHSATLVACSDDPFSKRVLLMSLTKPLSNASEPTTEMLQPKGQPWGLRLADGERCFFSTGATDVVAGMRMNYECDKGKWVLDFPDRSKSLWTAKTIAWPNRHVTAVNVSAAVF